MNIEHETKVLDFNLKEIEDKLINLGAKVTDWKTYRILSMKINEIDAKVKKDLRLRDEGDKVTLTYKEKNTEKLETLESETIVNTFDEMRMILEKIQFTIILYQEKKRKKFLLNNVEFVIDIWPIYLDPILEIEGKTREDMNNGLRLLGLKGKEIGDVDLSRLFKDKGLDLFSYKELKF